MSSLSPAEGTTSLLTTLNETTTPTTKSTTGCGTLTKPPSPTTTTNPLPTSRYYFAYGSNLSLTQMAARCPSARPAHLARAYGWRFIINARGYANVVPDGVSDAAAGVSGPGVFGVLYEITGRDEEALDGYEGVEQGCYEKVEMLVWIQCGRGAERVREMEGSGQLGRMALVYVDRERVEVGVPREEYVVRMNRGIQEARELLEEPLPGWYVEEVLRPFIPEAVSERRYYRG